MLLKYPKKVKRAIVVLSTFLVTFIVINSNHVVQFEKRTRKSDVSIRRMHLFAKKYIGL